MEKDTGMYSDFGARSSHGRPNLKEVVPPSFALTEPVPGLQCDERNFNTGLGNVGLGSLGHDGHRNQPISVQSPSYRNLAIAQDTVNPSYHATSRQMPDVHHNSHYLSRSPNLVQRHVSDPGQRRVPRPPQVEQQEANSHQLGLEQQQSFDQLLELSADNLSEWLYFEQSESFANPSWQQMFLPTPNPSWATFDPGSPYTGPSSTRRASTSNANIGNANVTLPRNRPLRPHQQVRQRLPTQVSFEQVTAEENPGFSSRLQVPSYTPSRKPYSTTSSAIDTISEVDSTSSLNSTNQVKKSRKSPSHYEKKSFSEKEKEEIKQRRHNKITCSNCRARKVKCQRDSPTGPPCPRPNESAPARPRSDPARRTTSADHTLPSLGMSLSPEGDTASGVPTPLFEPLEELEEIGGMAFDDREVAQSEAPEENETVWTGERFNGEPAKHHANQADRHLDEFFEDVDQARWGHG